MYFNQNQGNGNLSPLVSHLLGNGAETKRSVFISYHHKQDQLYYDAFRELFSERLELFRDNSLDREIDSKDSYYLNKTIIDKYIKGSSVTIVLCGNETFKRKWIDWEIHASLDKRPRNGLIGLILPDCSQLPKRLALNCDLKYANLDRWTDIADNPSRLSQMINDAANKRENYNFKHDNEEAKVLRNLS